MEHKMQCMQKYRVPEKWGLYPKFFGKRKRRGAGDEFYRDKIRASKVSVDDVRNGVLDIPQKPTNINKITRTTAQKYKIL